MRALLGLLTWVGILGLAACGASREVNEISIHTGTGWMLLVTEDGSGRIAFGSNPGDSAAFPKGTFAFFELRPKLEAVTHKSGTCPPEYGVAFHKMGTSSTSAVYTSEVQLVRQLMEQALAAARGNERQTVRKLAETHPFAGPDKKGADSPGK